MSDAMKHIGLVRREVKRWRWSFNVMLTQEDLEQEGLRGVLRALDKYDPVRGKFSTYAVPWIRHFIQREVYQHCRTVRVPMARSKEAYKRGEPLSLSSISLDDNTSRGPALHEQLALVADEDSGAFFEEQERKELVAHLLSTLPEREASVLRMRFFEDMTLFEAGRKLGMTKERARQIQTSAMLMISDRLRDAS